MYVWGGGDKTCQYEHHGYGIRKKVRSRRKKGNLQKHTDVRSG